MTGIQNVCILNSKAVKTALFKSISLNLTKLLLFKKLSLTTCLSLYRNNITQ